MNAQPMSYEQRQAAKRRLLNIARDPDHYVCKIRYRDVKSDVTDRFISTIGFKGSIVRALCLSSEEPRQFKIARILKIKLVKACDVQMPMPMIDVEKSSDPF